MVAPPVITLQRPATPGRRLLPVALLAVAVTLVAALFGLWWLLPLVGLVLGLLLGGFRSVSLAALSGLLGWGLSLLWEEIHVPLGPVASVVAGIMGVGSGVVVIAFTLGVAVLLAASGAWVGAALRAVIRR